jgi:hypothetical protein
MELLRAIGATFTFEITQAEAPPLGTQFKDKEGRIWTVRDTRQGASALRGPESPPGPYWNVTLEAAHPAYRIEPWSTLTRVWQNYEITAARDVLLTRFADQEGFEAVGIEPTSDGLIVYVYTDEAEAQVPPKVNGLRVRVKRNWY